MRTRTPTTRIERVAGIAGIRERGSGSHSTASIAASEETLKTLALFAITAVAEIIGCYLPYLWLTKGGSVWLLVPAAVSLAAFAWLLTLHPTAAGRVYAAYGGVYIAVALGWLWVVDGIRPTPWDAAGVAVSLAGMAIIAFQPQGD
jgi:small multidrug resistance family-3 protein